LNVLGPTKNFEKRHVVGLLLFIGLSVLIGFFLRVGFEMRGFESLNSDEVLTYNQLLYLVRDPKSVDFIPEWNFLRDFQKWIPEAIYFISDRKTESVAVGMCLINVLLSVLFSFLMVRRTGSYWAAVPFFVILIFPMPAISCWGTQISELRSYYFYSLILLWFAGCWFKSSSSTFYFGFLAAWGCWANLFTAFFVLPVIGYEKEVWLFTPWSCRLRKMIFLLAGVLLASLLSFRNAPWMFLSNRGYLNWGFHSFDQIKNYFYLFFVVWPIYWFGGVPWGYLQNSKLGHFLNPGLQPWFVSCTPFVFWGLWLWALGGTWFALRKVKKINEIVLWWGPSLLLAVFFVFGAQSWDALTLRYLSFWQIFLPMTLGLWASCLKFPWKNIQLVLIMCCWVVVHGFLLTEYFLKSPYEHPAHHIEVALEQNGYSVGYSNYWCSEVVNYLSEGRVLLEPYDHIPTNKTAWSEVHRENKIALVWIEGLDHPERFQKILGEIKASGYHVSKRLDFSQEGWFALGFEKEHS
jgi:hypothetical protein